MRYSTGMLDDLYRIYEGELTSFRQLAQEFGQKYPDTAGRLYLVQGRSNDPHVERLIEAFAFLTARVQNKLNDEFPELTDSLLNILYPHYLAPIPSMAIVQFELKAESATLPDGFLIPEGSKLKSPPVHDLPCEFRTTYPAMLWPIKLVQAKLQPPPFPQGVPFLAGTAAVLRLQFEMQGGLRFDQLSLDRLRIYLSAEGLIADLYELLFNDVMRVVLRPLDAAGVEPVILRPEEALHPVGFDLEEGMLPYPPQSFLGYRLLTEFFAFPAKFWFVDVAGWRQVAERGFQNKVEVDIYFRRTNTTLEQGLDITSFRLGCAPIINLFEQTCNARTVDQLRYEYRVVPSVEYPLGMEVHSITNVASADPNESRIYRPFYTFQHQSRSETFWHASRRPSERPDDRGTEVYLQFVGLKFNPALPADEVIVVDSLCTNRDLPAKLQQAGEKLAFDWMMAAPLERVRCVRLPTAPLRLPARRGLYWRLVSHLTLNHLSIADGALGRDALQELLRLYDYSDPEAGQQLANVNKQTIDGLAGVSHRRVVGRQGGTFCRGIEVTLEFDESKSSAYGIYLFASVLERFLALYASLNSFSQLVLRSNQREGIVKKWPPRAGEMPLL